MSRSLPEGEDRLIAWLKARADRQARFLGNDTVLLPLEGSRVVTVDTQIAGVHVPADLDPAVAARRLLAVNISDMAAAGARPRYALLALAAPVDFPHRRFLSALVDACDKNDVQLAGGDLARNSPWSAMLTLLGDLPERGRWLNRESAAAGHHLWLGGRVGESAIGLQLVFKGARLTSRGVFLPESIALPRRLNRTARLAVRSHLAPQPQTRLGLWLGEQTEAACMDVSDGLARDLHRLCRASGVGARLEAEAVLPGPNMCRLAAHLQVQALDLALFGGEDYVLLFTLPESVEPPAEYDCLKIGRIVAKPRIEIRMPDGRLERLADRGWDHLRRSTDDPVISPN